jgi:hypothetical protein
MANQYEDDDDFDEVEETPDQNGPANLRKALKRAEREKKEMAEQLAAIQADLRSRSVKEVLASKGVPDKVAKFIPGDVTTPEQIDSWLTDNADIFGFQKTEEAAQADEKTQANVAAYNRINASTQNANTPSREADLMSKLEGAKSIDELNAITGNPGTRFSRGTK